MNVADPDIDDDHAPSSPSAPASTPFPTPIAFELHERADPLKLVGCVFYGDPFHTHGGWNEANEIGLLWQRFMALGKRYSSVLERYAVNDDMAYEIHIEPEDYEQTRKLFVFVGIEVHSVEKMPLDMFAKVLPPATYASFTFKGADIYRGGTYIYNDWLPNSEYEEAYPICIQAYDGSRFFGLGNPDTEIQYLVPIRPRTEQAGDEEDDG